MLDNTDALSIIKNDRGGFNKYFLDGISEWSYETHDSRAIFYRYGMRAKVILYDDIIIWHTNKNLIEFINAKDRK